MQHGLEQLGSRAHITALARRHVRQQLNRADWFGMVVAEQIAKPVDEFRDHQSVAETTRRDRIGQDDGLQVGQRSQIG